MMADAFPMPNVAAFSAGEDCAHPLADIQQLHSAYGDRIFGFFLMQLRDRDAAFTLTQDTFLKVWRTRESFRGECSVRTWLMRVAVNLLRDHSRSGAFKFWRQAARDAVDAASLQDTLPARGRSAEQMLIAQQQVTALWGSLAGLSEKQRMVFTMRYIEEMELSEIVAATGLPMSTVKTHLYRALDRVRGAFEMDGRKGVSR